MDRCICCSPNESLNNTHFLERNITLSLLGKGKDKGIVIFENNNTIATFNIKYCPMCGKELATGQQGRALMGRGV